MIPITVKITLKQRDYVDTIIKSGQCASYGHSYRFLLHYYRTTKRIMERQKTELAVLRYKANGGSEEHGKELGTQERLETEGKTNNDR